MPLKAKQTEKKRERGGGNGGGGDGVEERSIEEIVGTERERMRDRERTGRIAREQWRRRV